MSRYEEAVVRALCAVARPVIRREWGPESCIASTRIACRVLQRFDISAYGLCVRVQAFNAAFVALVEQHNRMPVDRAELEAWTDDSTGAWSVGIGLPDPTKEWWGHVVAVANRRWLVDLSIDQASRPRKNLRLELFTTPVGERFLRGREDLTGRTPDGGILTYLADPRNKRFKEAPDWKEDGRHRAAIEEVYARTGRAVEAWANG